MLTQEVAVSPPVNRGGISRAAMQRLPSSRTASSCRKGLESKAHVTDGIVYLRHWKTKSEKMKWQHKHLSKTKGYTRINCNHSSVLCSSISNTNMFC